MNPFIVRRVVGHSMEPTLREGDLVLASSLLPIASGNLVVARVGDFDVVKRLIQEPDGQIVLVGDNRSEHHDITASDNVTIMGRVFWTKGI